MLRVRTKKIISSLCLVIIVLTAYIVFDALRLFIRNIKLIFVLFVHRMRMLTGTRKWFRIKRRHHVWPGFDPGRLRNPLSKDWIPAYKLVELSKTRHTILACPFPVSFSVLQLSPSYYINKIKPHNSFDHPAIKRDSWYQRNINQGIISMLAHRNCKPFFN